MSNIQIKESQFSDETPIWKDAFNAMVGGFVQFGQDVKYGFKEILFKKDNPGPGSHPS